MEIREWGVVTACLHALLPAPKRCVERVLPHPKVMLMGHSIFGDSCQVSVNPKSTCE